jgi:hypothetical protein
VKTSTWAQLRVDGIVFQVNATLGSISNTSPVILGANLKAHSDYYNGLMDDAGIALIT